MVLVVSNYTSDVIPCYTLTLLLAWVSNVICNTVRYIFLGNRIIEQGHCHGHFSLLWTRNAIGGAMKRLWKKIYSPRSIRRGWRKLKILFKSFSLFPIYNLYTFLTNITHNLFKYITFSMYTYAKFHFLNTLLIEHAINKWWEFE